MTYLEHTCPNCPTEGTHFTCLGEMGGPSIDTILAHDFSKGPFEDLRYCPKCRIFWRVIIDDADMKPKYIMLDKKEKVQFVRPWISNVEGEYKYYRWDAEREKYVRIKD